ncbi:S-methyl-5-thioribose kinase [Alicyclobacillus sp. ALC3]|uniref:S-methyl-5-thioribose kinase n=1 Tax=Alicyclobacillus sp. ALC3 TaxID=2796143 RepID=UPI002379C99F|nr:S-methyl-5-thioribose kinase [Alicyclobacillus sp. ALC3]
MSYTPLTEASVVTYVRRTGVATELFGDVTDIVAQDLADGNVNLVFRVYSASDPVRKSVIVKQALPYARAVGKEFKMPLDRTRIETEVLRLQAQFAPDQVPKVFHFDEEMHLVMMEDLNQHRIVRTGLIDHIRYPKFAKDIGIFVARTLFYTSDLYLSSEEKKGMVVKFMNPGLCKVTEDLVFTHPFSNHPENRVNPLLSRHVRELRSNTALVAKVNHYKTLFMTQAQALIHGDLHTGSIMVNQDETKVIDPEFAFFGPMGFDLGALIGNLALSYVSQECHIQDAAERVSYQKWLLDTISQIWHTFEDEFLALWNDHAVDWKNGQFQKEYVWRLLQETAGFGGTKMMRRIIGLAHVADMESIADENARAKCESLALNIGSSWVMASGSIRHIDDLLSMMTQARPSIGDDSHD